MPTRTWARLFPLLFTVAAALVQGCRDDVHAVVDGGGGDGGSSDMTVDHAADVAAMDLSADQSPDSAGPSDGGDVGGDSGGGGDGPQDTGSAEAGPLTTVQSFTTTVVITLTPKAGSRAIEPITQEMTVYLDPIARTAIFSRPGSAYPADLSADQLTPLPTPPPPGTFVLARSLGILFDVPDGCGSAIRVDGLTVVATTEGLVAEGAGPAQVIFGHLYHQYDATLSFTGTRDTTGPTLGPDLTAVDPLEAFSLLSSEAVPPAAVARLKTATDEVALVTGKASELDLAVAFKLPAARALRYGTTYQIEVDSWRDLGGLAGRPLPTLTTSTAPEWMAEDGFETAATMRGGAPVIEGPGLPPITGAKSAVVSPQLFSGVEARRFTVRLARQPGDTVLRAAVRLLSQFDRHPPSTYALSMRVAAPGGTIVPAQLPPNEEFLTRYDTPTGTPIAYLGQLQTIEIALPPSTGPEVVFDIITAPQVLCGLVPPLAGYLIDDLRLE